jgi:hypothetical protein
MANFFTDIAPNVIFSKDPTAVIDYYVQHKLPGDVCNCPMEMVTRPTSSAKDGFGWRCANSSIWTTTPGPPNSTGVDSSLVEQTSLKY